MNGDALSLSEIKKEERERGRERIIGKKSHKEREREGVIKKELH